VIQIYECEIGEEKQMKIFEKLKRNCVVIKKSSTIPN
jgi:hypothetical protein